MDSKDIKKAGLKVTGPRIKILSILEESDTKHMSAEDVYKALLDSGEDIGLATVYRVLTQFEAAGLVIRHRFESEHSVFEFDRGEHHDHLVCVECGRVEEFVDELIEQHQEKIAAEKGFQITDHSLCIYGICPGCHQ